VAHIVLIEQECPLLGQARARGGLDIELTKGYKSLVDGADVKRIRARLGLRQRELAEALGVHLVTVARWEVGTRRIPEPTARLIELIAKGVKAKKPTKRKR
jgi:DNA-binding transcriptional regulator YiaG